MEFLILIGAIFAVAGVAVAIRDKVGPSAEVRDKIAKAKDAMRRYEAAEARHKQALTTASSDLKTLKSERGALVAQLAGVKVYERWIETPEWKGSIVGVEAEAVDNTEVRQRLTATRIALLGKYSLAVPQAIPVGAAYVAITGPAFASGIVVPASRDGQAGVTAFALATKINHAARQAAVLVSNRDAALATAQQRVADARDRSAIDAAKKRYDRAIAKVPEMYRDRVK